MSGGKNMKMNGGESMRMNEQLICNNINFSSKKYSLSINFNFKHRIILVADDSGTGKTLAAGILAQASRTKEIQTKVVYINKLIGNIDIISFLKSIKESLIIVDNADLVLDKEARKYINTDYENQYLLFGRDFNYIVTGPGQVASIGSKRIDTNKNELTLKYASDALLQS